MIRRPHARCTRIALGLHAINLLGVVLMATLTVVMVWGFGRVNDDIARFDEVAFQKLDAIEGIEHAIGYGGMIHHLKNYVLRRDVRYAEAFDQAAADARTAIEAYRSASDVSPVEHRHLEKLEQLIEEYETALLRVLGAKFSAEQADTRAKVDDTDFIAALENLRRVISEDRDANLVVIKADAERFQGFAFILCTTMTLALLGISTPLVRRLHRSILDQITRANALRHEAELASNVKTEFLANMSHEIRTPMTSIIGYADTLADERERQDDQFTRQALDAIRSNADHLLSVLNDILDVTRIESGRLSIERRPIEPARLLNEVTELFRAKANDRGIDLSAEIIGNVPGRVVSDPTRLRRLVLNLVGNAMKFTEEGSVLVSMSHDAASNQLSLSVQDSGIGMSPSQLARITKHEAFTQADESTTRRFGGSGLGLRICHALCRLMGGELRITSEKGVGTTCTATVHAEPCQAKAEGTTPAAAPAQNASGPADRADSMLAGRSILLVEDGLDNQRLISHMLKKAGASVTIRSNGKEAVETLTDNETDQHFDLCLMDMQMPIMDGYTAASESRARGATLPIIALTADAMMGTRERCLEAGCCDYITKPLRRATLIEQCAAWIDRTRVADAA